MELEETVSHVPDPNLLKLTMLDALGDFSITGGKSNLTGFRDLIDFELVKCGAEGQKACTRAGKSLTPTTSVLC